MMESLTSFRFIRLNKESGDGVNPHQEFSSSRRDECGRLEKHCEGWENTKTGNGWKRETLYTYHETEAYLNTVEVNIYEKYPGNPEWQLIGTDKE